MSCYKVAVLVGIGEYTEQPILKTVAQSLTHDGTHSLARPEEQQVGDGKIVLNSDVTGGTIILRFQKKCGDAYLRYYTTLLLHTYGATQDLFISGSQETTLL